MKPKKQNGFSVIEVLVSLAILAIIVIGGTSIFQTMAQERSRNNTTAQLSTIRQNLSNLVSNRASWNATVAGSLNTASLACLRASSPSLCVNNASVSVVLYDEAGNPFYNTRTQGYDLNGDVCALSENTCIFQYVVRTHLSCGAGVSKCKAPATVTTGKLETVNGFNLKFPLNKSVYRFEIYQSVRDPATITAMSTIPRYSETCANSTGAGAEPEWKAKGWKSQDQCLKDGRWHWVFDNIVDNYGYYANSVTPGLLTFMQFAVRLSHGVSVKVASGDSDLGMETCQVAFHRGNGQIVCNTSHRVLGKNPIGSGPRPYVFGAVQWYTTGNMWCFKEKANFHGVNYNECNLSGPNVVLHRHTPMKWYIRY